MAEGCKVSRSPLLRPGCGAALEGLVKGEALHYRHLSGEIRSPGGSPEGPIDAEEAGHQGHILCPGWVAEKYPDSVEQVVKEGHEIAHHGYEHEDCSRLSREEERAMLRKGSKGLERVSGRRPRGFRLLPGKNTFELLAEEGFLYDSVLMDDDQPYRISIGGKPSGLVELPVCFAFNDTAYFVYTFGMAKPLLTPREVELVYKDEFDALYQEGRYCMFMLHPQLIGRASRLAMLERTIAHAKLSPGVWFATAEEVAEHCQRSLPR